MSGPVSASGDFTSGKNGSITGSLTLSPPPSTLDCPGGQREVLASVSYTNVQVSGGGDTGAHWRTSGVDVESHESALWTLRDGKVVRYEFEVAPSPRR